MLLDLFVLWNTALVGAGSSKGGKKRVFLERDGKILLFQNNAEAAAWVTAEKAAEKTQEAPQKAKKKVAKPVEPEVINLAALEAYYRAIQQQEMLAQIAEAKRKSDFDTLLRIQLAFSIYQAEEDDIEALLLVM